MSDEKLKEIITRADNEYDLLKDTVFHQSEEIKKLKGIIWQIKQLKHEWQDIEENTTLVFENNNLIDFMNKLENILKENKIWK